MEELARQNSAKVLSFFEQFLLKIQLIHVCGTILIYPMLNVYIHDLHYIIEIL